MRSCTIALVVLALAAACSAAATDPLQIIQPTTKLPLELYGMPVGTNKDVLFDLAESVDSAAKVEIEFQIDDIDSPAEGTLFVNGSGAIEWPKSLLGEGMHYGLLTLPKGLLKPGPNTLRFTFDSNLNGSTQGYIIHSASIRIDNRTMQDKLAAITSSNAGYRKLVLQTPGLASYWTLDTARGSLLEDLVGDNHAWAASCEAGKKGINGQSLGFDGRSSIVMIDGEKLASSLNGSTGLTLEFWTALADHHGPDQDLMVLRGKENYGSVVMVQGQTISGLMRSGKENASAASATLPFGSYAHVAVVADYANNQVGLFVNGQGEMKPAQFEAKQANFVGSDVVTTLGATNPDMGKAFLGWLDEVAIYKTALAPAVIKSHYEAGKKQAEVAQVTQLDPYQPIPGGKKTMLTPIISFCDWCHSYVTDFTVDGLQKIIDWNKEAGIKRMAWRCTDGGTTAYWSKLREPFHGLLPDNCHETYFMTADIPKFAKTDFRAWDTFGEFIKRSHAAGIKVYAWVQVAGEDDAWGYASKRVREHPEFCTVGRDGKRFAAKLAWSMPENHEYLLDLLKEILAYKPDGVILDFLKNQGDYRDQLTDDDGVALYGYEAPAVAAFKKKTGKDAFSIPNNDPQWIQFRADYVTQFARKARALQRKIAPGTAWIGQVWGGGGTCQFIRIPDAKPGEVQYRAVEHPVRDEMAGNMEDLATWSREGLFDAIYPLASTGQDMNGFRREMTRVRDKIKGGKSQLAAGVYVWSIPQFSADAARVAITEFGAKDLFLGEGLAYNGAWQNLKIAQELYGE